MKRTYQWLDQFIGHRVYSPTAGSNVGHVWKITDTSSTGTPTYVPASSGRGVTLSFDSQAEIQNVCLSLADYLAFDIDDLLYARFIVEMGQASIDSATSLAFGLCSARNDAIDSLTNHASFRLIGSASTTLVYVETDDGTTDKDDIATGKTLINVAKEFYIDLSDKASVKFLIGGEPVARSTTFDMSAATGSLQPYLQLQKTADANTDSVTLREVEIGFRGVV